MSDRRNKEHTPIEEARRRVGKVKAALLNLEPDLRLFRDGNEAQRNIFRQELDPGDVVYVGSLLTNRNGEEDMFDRPKKDKHAEKVSENTPKPVERNS